MPFSLFLGLYGVGTNEKYVTNIASTNTQMQNSERVSSLLNLIRIIARSKLSLYCGSYAGAKKCE